MGYYPSNCNEIESHIACECGIELARVRSVALIHKSVYSQIVIDVEDSSIWQAAIEAGLVIVLPQTQGDYDPQPINTRGFGYSEETFMAYNHVVNYIDPDYVGNLPHYNSINGSRNFHIAFRSETVLRISQRPCNLSVTNPIKNSLKNEVNYLITAKWTHNLLPLEYNIPGQVFECAPSVVYGASFDNSFDNSFDIP